MDLIVTASAFFGGVAVGVAYHAWIKPRWSKVKDEVKDKLK